MNIARCNADIVPLALRGLDARTSNGHFSTDHYPEGFPYYGAPYLGHLPKRLRNVLDARFREGAIRQVIYSYSTPIAWLDGDVWIVPDVRYSATTSTKHATHLWRLPNRRTVMRDTPIDEYMRVLADLMYYGSGRTFPGRNA